MAIIATPTEALFSEHVMLVANNTAPIIEDLTCRKRFYPFNLVIINKFTCSNKNAPLAFTDVKQPYTVYYPILDRLNKPITGDELYMYAGGRKCIQCVYDNLYKIIRVNSCIAPIMLEVPCKES